MAILIDAGADTYSATTGIPSGDFTVTCWAYVVAAKDPAGVVAFDDGAFTQWFILATRPDWGLRSNGLNLASGTTPSAAEWWKLAFVLSGSTGTMYGATELNTPAQMCTGTLTASTRTRLTIGGTPDTTQFWNGRIAAVKIWTAALTQAECVAELAQFDPVRTTSLQRYHPFHVAETTDYSGNGFALTAGTATTAADPPLSSLPLTTGTAGAVTHVATSTPTPVGTTTTASTTAVTPTLPTGTATGDRVYVVQAGNNTGGATPASWIPLAKDVQVGPTGTAPGAGTGRRYLSVYYRDYDGAWSMPAFSLTSAAQNTNACSAITLRKGTTDTWNTPTVSTAGNTASAVTSYSVTTGSLTTSPGMLIVGTALNDNVTASAETLSQTGATLAGLTERSDSGSATGNDVAIQTYTATVTTGATATLTHTSTLSGASEGGSIVLAQTSTAVAALWLRRRGPNYRR